MALPAILVALLLHAANHVGVGKADRIPVPVWMEIRADPILTVLTAPEKSRWISVDDGCELRPDPDGKSATFAAVGKGRYRILVVTGDAEPVRLVIVVGDLAPKPEPGDPITKRLQSAFDLDGRDPAKKRLDLAELIELYRQAAAFADRTDVTTIAELIGRIRDAAKSLVPEGLVAVRKAVAEELGGVFPFDGPLDAETRKKAKELFAKLSAALATLK